MPYMLISTEIRLDTGPTYVGDHESDPDLMTYLEAEIIKEPIKANISYRTKLLPRQVLNRLEEKGWTLMSSTGIGQTCVWTLHKAAQPASQHQEK